MASRRRQKQHAEEWATLTVGSRVASHAVAASLGHHSFAMTQKHYAQPAAIVNAGTARGPASWMAAVGSRASAPGTCFARSTRRH